MPRRKQSPEAKAEAHARKAEAARAQAATRRAADDARREARAEEIAPALLRNATAFRDPILTAARWADPHNPAKIVQSFRRTSAIWSLFQRSRHITIHHVKAAA